MVEIDEASGDTETLAVRVMAQQAKFVQMTETAFVRIYM